MSESALFSTGIVRYGQDTDYRCYLCADGSIVRTQDLHEHMENNQHVSAIRQFHLIFSMNSDSIDCKACNASIDWKGFGNHAEWHRIVPWYEIEDKDKKFFENRVLNVHSSFICVPCEKRFDDWTGAFVHVGQEHHRKLIDLEPPIHETFAPTDSSYGFLISEGFEPWGSTTVKCRPCLSPNVRLNNLQEHIAQPEHVAAKLRFIADTKYLADSNAGRKNGQNFVTDSNRNHNASGSINKSDTTSAIEKLVVGLRAGAFSDRDKISNLPSQHRSNSNSRMSNSGSHRRDSNRKNRYVHRSNSTSGSHNKDSNRQGNQSQRSNSSLRQNSSLDPPDSKSQSKNFTPRNGTANSGNGQTVPRGQKHNWPVETRGDSRWCTICNEVVQSTSDVHVAEERHTGNLKRLGREYVVAKGSHEFWCNCCKVKVPNLENVFRHIKGGRHRLNIPAARDERNEAADFKGAAKVKAQEEAKSERKREDKAEKKVEKEKGKVTSFKIDFSEASHPPAVNLPSLMQPIPFPQPLLGGLPGGIIPPHGRPVIRPVGPIPVQPMVYGPLNNYPPQPLMQFPMAMNNPAQPYLPLTMNNGPCPTIDSKFTPERLPRDYIIIQNANDLVCRICDVIIGGHGNLDEHIKHESHRRMVEDFCATIVPRGENNYYCNRCNASFNNRNDLYIHLCQFTHRGNQALVTNSQHANSRESSLGSSNLNVQKKSLITASIFSGGHIGNDFLVILGRFDFCCKLCHVLLQDHALIDIHLQDPEHRNAFHTYERRKIIIDNKYTCKSCKCVIPNFANVPPHTFGDQHRLKSPSSSTNCRSGSSELGPNFIVEIGEEDYYCVICNVTIIATSHLEQHLKDDMHLGSREKYGCDQIIAKNGGKKNLYCKCCICSIPEFDCVYVHLSGQRHMLNLASIRRDQLRQKENEASIGKDEASGEKEEAPKPVEKIADVEIKRQSEVVSPEVRESVPEVSSKKDEPSSASEQARIDAEKFVRMMEDEMNADLTHSLKIEEQMKRFTVDEDSMTSRSLASSTMSLNTSGKKLRAPRVKKPEIAAPVEIDIFEMREKLRELENDIRLCAHSDDPFGDRDLYFCMVCLESIGEKSDLYKHFQSHDHCDALVSKKMAHKEFELIADQFSDWDLAQEFLEEKSEDIIHCWACKDDLKNLDEVIRAHMANEIHIEKRDSIRKKNRSTFAKDIEPNIRCDWYDIQEFHCTLCNATYDSEFGLAEHTQSYNVHRHNVNEIDSTLRPLIYDFCATCSILWYADRSEFADHVATSRHDSRLPKKSTPESQKLRSNLADLIFDICRNGIEEMSADPYLPRRQFIADLEATVQQNFPGSKARVIAANPLSTDSGKFEVFLDFGVTLDGRSEDSVRFLAQRVASALSDHPAKWYMALTNDKNVPIKVTTHHLPSKSRVEIFLDDKLVLTPSKLFNSLRGASVYLDWPIRTVKFCMTLYENEFHEFMRPYIEDTMIFFLQSKSLFPKISDLVRNEDRLFFKPDWDLEVNGLETLKKYSEKPWDLMNEYHRFYATFDYRREVACPWIGEAVKKGDSAKLKNLSKGINSTCDLGNGGFLTPFCVQNPFGLMENRTREISKAQLNGFREYCSGIVEILERQGASNSD